MTRRKTKAAQTREQLEHDGWTITIPPGRAGAPLVVTATHPQHGQVTEEIPEHPTRSLEALLIPRLAKQIEALEA